MSEKQQQSGHDCEYLQGCVVWARFRTDSKFVWIRSYCQGAKQADCARKKQKALKLPVPDSLLPNGSLLG